ncbi:MAG: hypothetical protein AAGG11_02110 [Pseudomonadota bacterium]
MSAQRKRLVFWLSLAALVALGLAAAFWPRALAVDLVILELGSMTLTVGDEGRTRIVDVFVVSAPIAGRLRRIEAEPGGSRAGREDGHRRYRAHGSGAA